MFRFHALIDSELDSYCYSNDWNVYLLKSDGTWTYSEHFSHFSFGASFYGTLHAGYGGTYISADVWCVTQPSRVPFPYNDGCDEFEADGADGVCYLVSHLSQNSSPTEKGRSLHIYICTRSSHIYVLAHFA